MFGTLGPMELLMIFVVGLVFFGPRQLPEIGKTFGRMLGEFKRASADFQRTVEDEVEAEKLRKDVSTADYVEPKALPEASPEVAAPVIRAVEGSIPVSGLSSNDAAPPPDATTDDVPTDSPS